MIERETGVITEDEAALYDRQIRLWGLDAQKRLTYWYPFSRHTVNNMKNPHPVYIDVTLNKQ